MDSSSAASDPFDNVELESRRPSAPLILTNGSDVDETIYDGVAGMALTPRSLTPEVESAQVLPGLPDQTAPRASSQASSLDGSEYKQKINSRPAYARAFSHEQNKHGKSKVQSQLRRRTRTLEEGVVATQGASRRDKGNRQRVGSVQEATTVRTTEFDELEGSSSNHGEPSHRYGRRQTSGRPVIPPRKASNRPVSQTVAPATSTMQKLAAQSQPPDARRSLHLMVSTRGRMQGPLFFREGLEGSWYLSKCFISTETGSLLCETSYGRSPGNNLVPDLRGAHVQVSYDHSLQTAILNVRTPDIPNGVQLRPMDPTFFDLWFAALLCWQPLNVGVRFKSGVRKSLPSALIDTSSSRGKFTLESASTKDGSIIKVGKSWLLESEHEESTAHHFPGRRPPSRWVPVSCVLYQNALLKICTISEVTTIAKVRLSKLPRNALQRLDSSLFNTDSCLGIYPQYAKSADACSRVRPMYLAFESRVIFEVWFVLLRAFMVPEIFGHRHSDPMAQVPAAELLPGISSDLSPTIFRIERSLTLKVLEARLYTDRFSDHASESGKTGSRGNSAHDDVEFYCQVVLDGQVKAKTSSKNVSENPTWFESFHILDLGSAAPFMCIHIMRREIRAQEDEEPEHNIILSPDTESLSQKKFGLPDADVGVVLGEAEFDLSKQDQNNTVEQWYQLLDVGNKEVGKILLRLRPEQDIVLMDVEYQQMSELLHNFSSGLTLAMSEKIPSELSEVGSRMSNCLLNIYQSSGRAADWLMALAEEEVDGTRKEQRSNKLRYTGRVDSNETKDATAAYGLPPDREGLVRDLGKSFTAEVNLLFRGNTLLSKSLDAHMKRLGKEYLEETIGAKMRGIAGLNPDCEVDPNRMAPEQNYERNWRRLISLTQEVWGSISQSAHRCPMELRVIFRHIRACADDRYGDFMRNVTYSSISGFLFLRFMCPAILNPKAFGLIKDPPKSRAQRTFTLIAKALQGLANLTTFGAKETWMEPMNQFIVGHRQAFKGFIDAICSVPSDQSTSNSPPSYSTPRAIFTRVPAAYKEGYPSLPYLVDPTRDFATLVSLWLDNYTTTEPLEGELLHFHTLCVSLRQRTNEAYERAERTEKRNSSLSNKWVGVAERMESNPWLYWVDQSGKDIQRKDMASPPKTADGDVTEAKDIYTTSGVAGDTEDQLDSSQHLTSTTSSDEAEVRRPSSRHARKKQKEKDKAKFGLFNRKRRADRQTE